MGGGGVQHISTAGKNGKGSKCKMGVGECVVSLVSGKDKTSTLMMMMMFN